jgi:hypothetical protein
LREARKRRVIVPRDDHIVVRDRDLREVRRVSRTAADCPGELVRAPGRRSSATCDGQRKTIIRVSLPGEVQLEKDEHVSVRVVDDLLVAAEPRRERIRIEMQEGRTPVVAVGEVPVARLNDVCPAVRRRRLIDARQPAPYTCRRMDDTFLEDGEVVGRLFNRAIGLGSTAAARLRHGARPERGCQVTRQSQLASRELIAIRQEWHVACRYFNQSSRPDTSGLGVPTHGPFWNSSRLGCAHRLRRRSDEPDGNQNRPPPPASPVSPELDFGQFRQPPGERHFVG